MRLRPMGATGYGFLRIQAGARGCADYLERTGRPHARPPEPLVCRLMDRIFLRAVGTNQDRAAEFLAGVAHGLEPAAFVPFMTDSARTQDDLRLAGSLPPGLFNGPARRRSATQVASIYTVPTVALAAGVWYAVGTAWAMDTVLLRSVFIGLAALTVPHMALALDVEHREPGDA